MKRLNIYLAGACKGLVDEGTSWRNEAFERFILAQKYLDLIAYHLYDPTEYFPRDGSKSITAKQTKNFYIKYLIANSDLILVNLNNTENSVGTAQELQYAVDKGIPVIGFGKQNVYEWLPEDCDVVFDTLEEAVDYIINYYD